MAAKPLKIFLSTLFFSIICFSAYGDATFLSDLTLGDSYADYSIIASTEEQGINQTEFLEFMLSDENDLGSKIALLSALSAYFEWKSDGDEEYFTTYGRAFEAKVLQKYKANSIRQANVPPAYLLLYYLIQDFDTTSPDLENYLVVAQKMPRSLSAQAMVLFSQAYYRIYNDGRTVEDQQSLRTDYYNSFKANYRLYEPDMRLQAAQSILDWAGEAFQCFSITDWENLPCYCNCSTEDYLSACLAFATDSLTAMVKNAEMYPKEHSSDEDMDRFREAIADYLSKEKDFINSLNISDLNKNALRYLAANQTLQFTSGFSGFMAMGSAMAWYSYVTPYVERFGKEFSLRSECKKIDESTAFSDESPFYKTTCFKNYVKALEKEITSHYNKLGGASNLKLKEAQQAWEKVHYLYVKELGNGWEMYNSYSDKEVLAGRLGLLHYYLDPVAVSDLYVKLLVK